MNKLSSSLNDDIPQRRWIVDFKDFRTRDETQRRAIDKLQEMGFEVVKIWLKVLTPDAMVVEPSGQCIRRISFHRRSEMRRFLRTFGGRQLRPSKVGGRS